MKHRCHILLGVAFLLLAVLMASAQTNIPVAIRPSFIWNDGYSLVVLWKADDVPPDYSIESSYDLSVWRVETTAVSWPRGQFAVWIDVYDPLVASKFYRLSPAVVTPTKLSPKETEFTD